MSFIQSNYTGFGSGVVVPDWTSLCRTAACSTSIPIIRRDRSGKASVPRSSRPSRPTRGSRRTGARRAGSGLRGDGRIHAASGQVQSHPRPGPSAESQAALDGPHLMVQRARRGDRTGVRRRHHRALAAMDRTRRTTMKTSSFDVVGARRLDGGWCGGSDAWPTGRWWDEVASPRRAAPGRLKVDSHLMLVERPRPPCYNRSRSGPEIALGRPRSPAPTSRSTGSPESHDSWASRTRL